MSNQKAPYERHSQNLTSAVEVMSAILEEKDDAEKTQRDMDMTLTNYITTQMIGSDETIPENVWGLLSGFVALTHTLLVGVEKLSGEPKQAYLDRCADVGEKLRKADLPEKAKE
ncbi:hypothetical protein [Mycobacterium colombiense]|uniref:hypothetical protein n=1 Tax=Mycobacterium colombiense TaxID=339268 RepID=UPI0008009139|nr:hypothetical protein [Mycobacterium colombiense]OBJ72285.1 hypothetical protein A5627_21975 [Mycobacterium colombiense]